MTTKQERMDAMATLSTVRRSANITLAQVADELGVTRGTVSRWETGKWVAPSSRVQQIKHAIPVLMMRKQDEDGDRASKKSGTTRTNDTQAAAS